MPLRRSQKIIRPRGKKENKHSHDMTLGAPRGRHFQYILNRGIKEYHIRYPSDMGVLYWCSAFGACGRSVAWEAVSGHLNSTPSCPTLFHSCSALNLCYRPSYILLSFPASPATTTAAATATVAVPPYRLFGEGTWAVWPSS